MYGPLNIKIKRFLSLFFYQIWQLSTSGTDCSYYRPYVCKTTGVSGRSMWMSIGLHSLQLHLYPGAFSKLKGPVWTRTCVYWVCCAGHGFLELLRMAFGWLLPGIKSSMTGLESCSRVYTVRWYCCLLASTQPRYSVPFIYHLVAIAVSTETRVTITL